MSRLRSCDLHFIVKILCYTTTNGGSLKDILKLINIELLTLLIICFSGGQVGEGICMKRHINTACISKEHWIVDNRVFCMLRFLWKLTEEEVFDQDPKILDTSWTLKTFLAINNRLYLEPLLVVIKYNTLINHEGICLFSQTSWAIDQGSQKWPQWSKLNRYQCTSYSMSVWLIILSRPRQRQSTCQ